MTTTPIKSGAVRNVSFKQRANRYRTYINRVTAHLGEPEHTNPYKALRESYGLTLEELAAHAGVSKQSIIRLEQGVPDKPIEPVLNHMLALGHNSDDVYFQLTNGYDNFKFETRCRNSFIFGKAMPSALSFFDEVETHPFKILLDQYWHYADNDEPVNARMNPTEFSKLLCVNQSIVDHWLNHPQKQLSVPQPVLSALADNGYAYDQLRHLQYAYENHRHYIVTGEKTLVSREETLSHLARLKDQMIAELSDG